MASVRFPVVLFDLDGTVVDSGAIILASMRHADARGARAGFSDEELMQAVGGPGLEAQMAGVAPERVDELVRVYRAHNEPLHEELEACEGMEDVLVRLHEEGGRLGVVTAKRRATVELAFARCRSPTSSRRSSAATRPRSTSPTRSRCCSRRAARRRADGLRVRRRLAVRHPRSKAAGMYAVAVTWGGIHDRERLEREEPDAIVDTAEELLERL